MYKLNNITMTAIIIIGVYCLILAAVIVSVLKTPKKNKSNYSGGGGRDNNIQK